MSAPDWYDDALAHIWQPYSQMKSAAPPLAVTGTQGSRIRLADGRELIDGVASWWTACHGYHHPHIRDAVMRQVQSMPHVMFGGIVHEQAAKLATRLAALMPGDLDHVFFSDSGSVAVEVAVKMTTQYWVNRGIAGRTKLIAFKGAYHGDTIGTMALCDPDAGMHRLYRGLLPTHVILDLPEDEASIEAFEIAMSRHAEDVIGIIVEPLVQGAGGMLFHDQSVLRYLRDAADRYDLPLIFDEIFTGFGRTGTMFAFERADVAPDIICLSKALTGGTLPLAVTIATRRIFDAFWSDDPMHALMHGPTYMANALGCAAANASLDLFEREPRLRQVSAIEAVLKRELEHCRALKGVVDIRARGAIGVVEMQSIEDVGSLRQRFIAEGVFIRPFGNVVYLTPAFTIDEADLVILARAMSRLLS